MPSVKLLLSPSAFFLYPAMCYHLENCDLKGAEGATRMES